MVNLNKLNQVICLIFKISKIIGNNNQTITIIQTFNNSPQIQLLIILVKTLVQTRTNMNFLKTMIVGNNTKTIITQITGTINVQVQIINILIIMTILIGNTTLTIETNSGNNLEVLINNRTISITKIMGNNITDPTIKINTGNNIIIQSKADLKITPPIHNKTGIIRPSLVSNNKGAIIMKKLIRTFILNKMVKLTGEQYDKTSP